MKPIIFLDRDATLMVDTVYPNDPAKVELIPVAADAVRELAARGYHLAVVSNQSGIARGFITLAQAQAVDARFVELMLTASGVKLPTWYCPHGPEDRCDCRKPAPGLLLQAAAHFGTLITSECIMIGDKPSDLAAGQNAGCGINLLFTGDWPAVLRQIPS
jgi:D-glycero-D-manno-heptose 1,7-bisphosphate phosphatase